jgi:hypothetical protein
MIDRDVEQRLRDWFLDEVDGTQVAPPTLRDGLLAVTGETQGDALTHRRWLMLAAAAVLAVVLAAAAAIGSGLIRPPAQWQPGISLSGCRPTLADELALSVWRERRGSTYVYRDGRVIASGWPYLSSARLQQRRLTRDGLVELLASAIDPRLRGCRDVPIDGADDLHVTVRDGGSINAFHTGFGQFSTARADQSATNLAGALYNGLMDRDLGLSAGRWADAAWTDYQADRYVVTVTLPRGTALPTSGPLTVSLPDGSTSTTFGQEIPGVDSTGAFVTRCGVVDADAADAISGAFARAGVIPSSQSGNFSVSLSDDPYGGLYARAALPHEHGCADVYPPPTAEDPALTAVDVCGLLDGGAMPDELGDQPPSGLGKGVRWRDDDGGAAACDFTDDTFSTFYRIERRLQRTSGAEAEALAQGTFGDGGYRRELVAGRTTYLDACAYAGLPCEPAIIISADPNLIWIQGTRQPTPEQTADVLRALAELAIGRLGQ